MSGILLLSNMEFGASIGVTPANLLIHNMIFGADWRESCPYAQWPEWVGANVKCDMRSGVSDFDSIIEGKSYLVVSGDVVLSSIWRIIMS